MTTRSIPDWLQRRSVTHPDMIALAGPGRNVTYRQLYNQATLMAGAITRHGVSGYVALLTKDSYNFAVSIHAFIQAGLVVVPLNWRLTTQELAWQIKDAQIRWVLYDEAESAIAKELVEQVSGLEALDFDSVQEAAGGPVCNDYIGLSGVHAVIYTSGTTGNPKGTQITYGNEWWSATGSALQLGILPTDRWLVPMPLFHMGGLSVLIRSVIYGITAVLHNGFDVDAVNRSIDSQEVTLASLVPTMLSRLLAQRGHKAYPDSLRAILLGGSAASQALLEAAKALGVQVAQSYGMTETASQVCTLPPRDFHRKLGSSGLPAVMNEVIVVDEGLKESGESPLLHQRAPGVPGEIVVRGPTVTPGYLHNPEATRESIRDGWLFTGDIGYVDDEGYLYVLDRRRDLIVSGGENVYPAEVESALAQHPAVLEAGVVGVRDEDWGQVPVAAVVLKERATTSDADLETFCRSVLAGYKVPREFIFVEQLPRNAAGKLLRRNLQAWLEKEEEQTQR